MARHQEQIAARVNPLRDGGVVADECPRPPVEIRAELKQHVVELRLARSQADELHVGIAEQMAQRREGQIKPFLLDQAADQPDHEHVVADFEVGVLLKLALVGRALLAESCRR